MILSYSVKIPGPYHIEKGLPCQDAFSVKTGKDGYYVAAVADGLGSEKYSDIGSETAVNTAVQFCVDSLSSGMTDDDIQNVIRESFSKAYNSVLERAISDEK